MPGLPIVCRLQGCARENLRILYAARRIHYSFLYTSLPKVHSLQAPGKPMDFVYLLFGFVLAAATLGFLMLCDHLGPRG